MQGSGFARSHNDMKGTESGRRSAGEGKKPGRLEIRQIGLVYAHDRGRREPGRIEMHRFRVDGKLRETTDGTGRRIVMSAPGAASAGGTGILLPGETFLGNLVDAGAAGGGPVPAGAGQPPPVQGRHEKHAVREQDQSADGPFRSHKGSIYKLRLSIASEITSVFSDSRRLLRKIAY